MSKMGLLLRLAATCFVLLMLDVAVMNVLPPSDMTGLIIGYSLVGLSGVMMISLIAAGLIAIWSRD